MFQPVLSWADLSRFFQGELSTWLRKRLWCCGMWGSQTTMVFVLKTNRAGTGLGFDVGCYDVGWKWRMNGWTSHFQPWKTLSVHQPTPWKPRISPTQWSCLLVAEVPECFFVVLTELQGFFQKYSQTIVPQKNKHIIYYVLIIDIAFMKLNMIQIYATFALAFGALIHTLVNKRCIHLYIQIHRLYFLFWII